MFIKPLLPYELAAIVSPEKMSSCPSHTAPEWQSPVPKGMLLLMRGHKIHIVLILIVLHRMSVGLSESFNPCGKRKR